MLAYIKASRDKKRNQKGKSRNLYKRLRVKSSNFNLVVLDIYVISKTTLTLEASSALALAAKNLNQYIDLGIIQYIFQNRTAFTALYKITNLVYLREISGLLLYKYASTITLQINVNSKTKTFIVYNIIYALYTTFNLLSTKHLIRVASLRIIFNNKKL